MKKVILSLLVMAILLAAGLPILAEAGAYGKYLTAAEVEKAGGLKGVVMTESGNKLKFKDQHLILEVQFLGAKTYKLNKETKEYVKAMVAGVGEEAFSGPAADPQYVLIFRQKDFCVRLTAYMNSDGKFVLTMKQLIALGKIIASRI
jgi:hypothetical protein